MILGFGSALSRVLRDLNRRLRRVFAVSQPLSWRAERSFAAPNVPRDTRSTDVLEDAVEVEDTIDVDSLLPTTPPAPSTAADEFLAQLSATSQEETSAGDGTLIHGSEVPMTPPGSPTGASMRAPSPTEHSSNQEE